MRKISIALSAFCVVFATTALAERFPLQKAVDVPQNDFGGKVYDVLGIYPGQSPEDAKAIFIKIYDEKGVEETEQRFGTRELQTEPFAKEIKGRKGGRYADQASATFGSPTIGGQVIRVSRGVEMDPEKPRPTLEEMANQLIQKYGEPGKRVNEPGAMYLTWYRGGEEKCASLDRDLCKVSGGYEIDHYEAYKKEANLPFDVLISASIYDTPRANDGKVMRFSVSVVDVKRRAISAAEDEKQFEAKLESFRNQTGQMPEL